MTGTLRTDLAMGTMVTIQVVHDGAGDAIGRAFDWFQEVERRCTRFRDDSELRQLTAQAGNAVEVSPILFEAVQFALRVAAETGGAFDPTVGGLMEVHGFAEEYRTGRSDPSGVDANVVSYRDVELDKGKRTIRLLRPLLLDLGAVAKGLAIDLAARELSPFRDFAIDAGGDLYLGGTNPHGEPWKAGIRHPYQQDVLIDRVRVTNRAVCTSGDYERGPHIRDPRTGEPADAAASVTVVAEGAMLADALATAAWVLGPREGIRLLDRMSVEGLIFDRDLERYETRGLQHAA